MKKKVIICDSGISERHFSCVQSVDVGCGWKDNNGHGSVLIDIIQLIVPDTEIISIKILNEENECSLNDLLLALEKCEMFAENAIICLALAIEEEYYIQPIANIIRKLIQKNNVVVSSVFNNMPNSFPACMKEVIGVRYYDEEKFEGQYYYTENEIQCYLPYMKIIAEGINGIYQMFGGNSLLCALLVTHILHLFDEIDEVDMDLLQSKLEKQTMVDLYFNKFILDKSINENEKVNKTIDCILRDLGYDESKGLIYQIESMNELNILFSTLKNNGLDINKKKLFLIDYLGDGKKIMQYFNE